MKTNTVKAKGNNPKWAKSQKKRLWLSTRKEVGRLQQHENKHDDETNYFA